MISRTLKCFWSRNKCCCRTLVVAKFENLLSQFVIIHKDVSKCVWCFERFLCVITVNKLLSTKKALMKNLSKFSPCNRIRRRFLFCVLLSRNSLVSFVNWSTFIEKWELLLRRLPNKKSLLAIFTFYSPLWSESKRIQSKIVPIYF